MPKRSPETTYRVRVTFRAPLDFVYRWCTEYRSDDAKLEAEEYQRRILRRSRREVVYEDLEDTPDGWSWSRHVVRLLPPRGWHSDSVGSHRSIVLDYRLSPISDGRTELVLTARRRPMGVGTKNPSKAAWVRSVNRSWAHLSRSLEKDYRRSRTRKRRT